MVGQAEAKKLAKQKVKELPYPNEIHRAPSRTMKQQQLGWLMNGLHCLKAPIASYLKRADGMGWWHAISRNTWVPYFTGTVLGPTLESLNIFGAFRIEPPELIVQKSKPRKPFFGLNTWNPEPFNTRCS